MQAAIYKFLADLILAVHFGIVTFVVVGLMLIWIGYFAHWRFVRNAWFRLFHLVTMGIVAAQAVWGQICPLTIWENQLREAAGVAGRYDTSFIQHWIGRILFYNVAPVIFTVSYLVFFVVIVLSLIVVRPEPIRFRRRDGAARPHN